MGQEGNALIKRNLLPLVHRPSRWLESMTGGLTWPFWVGHQVRAVEWIKKGAIWRPIEKEEDPTVKGERGVEKANIVDRYYSACPKERSLRLFYT